MLASSNMNSFPFSHLPSLWFVSRREYLETYYQELVRLRDKLTRLIGGQNVAAILDAAESLKHLNEQIRSMEETFETHFLSLQTEPESYLNDDLRRIRELASSISNNLDAIARQVSWGQPAEAELKQVRRNLYPLLELIGDTLKWLEQGT